MHELHFLRTEGPETHRLFTRPDFKGISITWVPFPLKLGLVNRLVDPRLKHKMKT